MVKPMDFCDMMQKLAPNEDLPMTIKVFKNEVKVLSPLGIATARCKPGDEFDLMTGITICLKRLSRGYMRAYGIRK